MKISSIIFLFMFILSCATNSHALTQTFMGEDLGLGEGTRLNSYPNASSANAAFLSNLVGVGAEKFESFSTGASAPLNVLFSNGVTATLNGTGSIATVSSGTNGFGRYPISGSNYYEASGVFSIDFSAPIVAFGFYGIDIGDFNGQVTATTLNGSSHLYNVGNSMNISGGSVLFWGLIDTLNPFTSITFGNTNAGTDFFGFDDFTIGTIQQVAATPEPGTMVLMGLGAVGAFFLKRRHGRAAA
ncbi:PEP-CTERM sorting domain-containing protein [Fundidesulfovibrio putealis]|uniref:PEP-CTERM sorting domain-containing protein n=1 Tax=Fundidesulfovibrio putealis TaxID=270496 RepID=UPI000428F792|nr:PEP-CTERM sorting domain-containing protein [Fundidesulfovibrio putealis]